MNPDVRDNDLRGVAATAKLGTHPIHPMLVPFPIVFFVATFACDVAYWATANEFWAIVAMWALGAAIGTSALAASMGLIDFLGNAQIRAMSAAWQHMLANVANVVLAVVSFAIRMDEGAAAGIVPWGIALSTVILVLLLFAGWKGGQMVFEGRVGMQPEAPKPAEQRETHPVGTPTGATPTLRR